MLTAYDVDRPTSDRCFYCNGTPVVSLADANLCQYHAVLEMQGWEKYLPPVQTAPTAEAVQAAPGNCSLCGSWGHSEENCPRANR